MTKSIDFYFDFISPYSYLAHKQLENIKRKKEINFNYKPHSSKLFYNSGRNEQK